MCCTPFGYIWDQLGIKLTSILYTNCVIVGSVWDRFGISLISVGHLFLWISYVFHDLVASLIFWSRGLESWADCWCNVGSISGIIFWINQKQKAIKGTNKSPNANTKCNARFFRVHGFGNWDFLWWWGGGTYSILILFKTCWLKWRQQWDPK